MFLVEHCVPLMAWGAIAFAAGILCTFGAWFLLLGGKVAAEHEHWACLVLAPLGLFGLAASMILVIGGKVAFLLGVLGCVLSVFAK